MIDFKFPLREFIELWNPSWGKWLILNSHWENLLNYEIPVEGNDWFWIPSLHVSVKYFIPLSQSTCVNHSFYKRNKNYFSTWVSLGILLLYSDYHIFRKRNENKFSTCVFLGIFLLCSVNHSFHKRKTKMTSPHESLKVFSCCAVFTTHLTRETKMNSPHESL